MKKILLILVVFSLFTSPFSLKAAAQSDIIRNNQTGIPDKGLYKSILWNLGKRGKGTFTKKEAAKIKDLNTGSREIKSLKGIKYLKNLQCLFVTGNKLTKLTGLESLKHLKILFAANNKLTDISAIKKLTKLECINVSRNKLTKLPDLTKFKWLDAEITSFTYNKLSRKQLEKKLPKVLIKHKSFEGSWFNDQIVLQNINKKIELDTPKSFDEITTTTKTISGTAQKNAYVSITLNDDDRTEIYFVKVNSNGKFKFTDLCLEEYEGQELRMLSAHECFENSTPIFAIKSFIVKKG